MDGLKYILREIEARRGFLHDFQKGMDIANSKEFILAPSLSDALKMAPEFLEGELANSFQKGIEDLQKSIEDSKEFTLFSEGVPDFVQKMSPGDGQVLYKATSEAKSVILMVKDFNTLYKKQFNDLRQYSSITVPLWPNEPPPENYEINEMLGYDLGGGICAAWLFMQIWSPSIQQPDRQFYVSVEDRYVPEQRSSPKTEEGVAITPEAYPYNWWEQDVEEQAKMAFGMQGAFLYNWWEKDRREARPGDYPAEIIINESTTSEQVWEQLLISAWGHNYFNEAGQTKAYEELKRYFRPEVLNSIIMHLSKHLFNPYDKKSNMAYLNRLSELFWKTHKQKSKDLLYRNAKNPDGNLSIAVPRRFEKSVLWASLETGIPIRTIYHLVKKGKLKKAADSSKKGVDAGDIIILSDDAIEKLKQLATLKKKRKAIKELAKLKGKSDEAIKKWLQRHNLSDKDFEDNFKRWLGIR